MSRDVARVLVADDETSIRFVLREALEEEGHEVVEAASGDAAWEFLAAGGFDIAFLDIRMPELTGLELLERLRSTGSEVAAVVMTAQNTLDHAVEAMKHGALDYLAKPFQVAEVVALVDKALRVRELEREVRHLRREVGRPPESPLVGRSKAVLEVFKMIGRVAPRNVPVLIHGESGTGKELVARAIHGASPRAASAFVAVNSAAIPRELLESEMFGHERGAFTGATESRPGRFREAHLGTLFLDEIGDMPADLQAKLLRVLQSGEVTSVGGKHSEQVDVRVVAATHRDLDEEVGAGRFREDLLYRLRVVPLHIPPLRERADDVAVLAAHFAARYSVELQTEARVLSDEALGFLAAQPWPGNVRELENAIKRALVLGHREVLSEEDFAFLTEERRGDARTQTLEDRVRSEAEAAFRDEGGAEELYRSVLERVERPLIEAALSFTGGNQLRAATLLGINRNTLRKKITELDIQLPVRS